MQTKLRPILLVLYLLFIGTLTACGPNCIYPVNSDPVGLVVSGHIDRGADPKHCGKLQATLIILSDHSVIQSPILDIGNSFYESADKPYNRVRVRIEAHCYEAGGISGKIIVEGKTYGRGKPGSNSRWFWVSRYNPPNFNEDCVTKNPMGEDKNRDFKVIELVEPIPCVFIDSFSP